MNLGLYVEKLSVRRAPPPAYSPNPNSAELVDADPHLQNATLATLLRRPPPFPNILIHQSATSSVGSKSARPAPSLRHEEGATPVPVTERLQYSKTTTALSWGPQFATTVTRPSSIPQSIVAIPERSARGVMRIGPGFRQKIDVGEHVIPSHPVMKLPRSNSAQLRRKMVGLVDPKVLLDQITPVPRRRYRAIAPEPCHRDEIESLSSWVKQKLQNATDNEYAVQVVATAIDDLTRQVGQQMAERGVLLADLIDRDRQSRRAIAENHEQRAIDEVKNLYRERIMSLIDNQRSELQRYNDERLEIWNECEQLRNHIMERNEMLSELQYQMDKSVQQRDDIIQRQEQTAFQLQCALDDLSVRFNESQQQLSVVKSSLDESNVIIAEMRLDLRFAAERESLTVGKRVERAEELPSAIISNIQEGREGRSIITQLERSTIGNELAHRAATRIQSLVRGRKARRHASDLGNVANVVGESMGKHVSPQPIEDGSQHLSAVPPELAHLFQCPPEVYRTYFQQEIPFQKFLRWLSNVVLAKSDYDVYSAQTSTPRPSFAEMIYDYYLSQHSQRESVELDLLDLCHNLIVYRSESARVRLFSRYLSEDVSRVTEAVLIAHEGLRFYACGPFENAVDNSEGICWIDVPAAINVLRRMFRQLPEADLNSAMQKIQARAKTLGVARQFTGASRAAYKGIDRFMDLDDCLELVWDFLRAEDQRLTAALSESYSSTFSKGRIDSEDAAPTLNDFEVMLRVVDQKAADAPLRLLHIYRNAAKLATRRRITIDDLVTSSRNAGISPIKVNMEEFPRLTASKIQRLKTENDDDVALAADSNRSGGAMVVYHRTEIADEQVAMMQRRLAAMREKVIDTANTWKTKLERMQEKYDGLSSKLRTEYETRLADLLTQERDQAAERLHALEDQHRAKLQLCFEKFEEHRGASDVIVDDLRAKLRMTQNELRRLATESATEKQQLYDAVDSLSVRLQEEVNKSCSVADDLARGTTRLVEDLSQGTALMAEELTVMTRMMERSRMGEEDCRARLLAQAVRQASEANMLRRGKLMRTESIRAEPGLVATIPPVTSLDFDGGQRNPPPPVVSRQGSSLFAGMETAPPVVPRRNSSLAVSRQASLKNEDEFQFG